MLRRSQHILQTHLVKTVGREEVQRAAARVPPPLPRVRASRRRLCHSVMFSRLACLSTLLHPPSPLHCVGAGLPRRQSATQQPVHEAPLCLPHAELISFQGGTDEARDKHRRNAGEREQVTTGEHTCAQIRQPRSQPLGKGRIWPAACTTGSTRLSRRRAGGPAHAAAAPQPAPQPAAPPRPHHLPTRTGWVCPRPHPTRTARAARLGRRRGQQACS